MARLQTTMLDKDCPAVVGSGPRALFSVCETKGWTQESLRGTCEAASVWENLLGFWRGPLSKTEGLSDMLCGTQSVGVKLEDRHCYRGERISEPRTTRFKLQICSKLY